MCSDEYQNYLITTDYNISLVKKQFHSVRSISRNEARQVKRKLTQESFNLVTVYNPLLNNLQKIIKNNLPLLYSDPDMRAVFREGSINVTYRRERNLKELISASFFPQQQLTTKSQSMVSKCGKKCDICDNFLVCRNEFTCKVTGKTYKVKGNLSCNSANVVYLISCKLCKDQYVGSPIIIILSLDLGYIRVILTQVRTGVVWLNICLVFPYLTYFIYIYMYIYIYIYICIYIYMD